MPSQKNCERAKADHGDHRLPARLCLTREEGLARLDGGPVAAVVSPQEALVRQRRAHKRHLRAPADVRDDALSRIPQHLGALLLECSVLRAARGRGKPRSRRGRGGGRFFESRSAMMGPAGGTQRCPQPLCSERPAPPCPASPRGRQAAQPHTPPPPPRHAHRTCGGPGPSTGRRALSLVGRRGARAFPGAQGRGPPPKRWRSAPPGEGGRSERGGVKKGWEIDRAVATKTALPCRLLHAGCSPQAAAAAPPGGC
jgi:hypothetical protein